MPDAAEIARGRLLAEALAEAEAKVELLKREIAAGPCREYGHDWQSYGGCNAGCSDDCSCSVPVNMCAKCGDCDYGDNAEANDIRANCLAIRAELLKDAGDARG